MTHVGVGSAGRTVMIIAAMCCSSPTFAATPPPDLSARLDPAPQRPPKKQARPETPKALVPHIPAGMAPCKEPMRAVRDFSRHDGEAVRYQLRLDGINMGIIDFRIEQTGLYEGRPVTEYRSQFKLDSLVSTFVPVQGRAASLVPVNEQAPLHAMNRYQLSGTEFEEEKRFREHGQEVTSMRARDGKQKLATRRFTGPALDFVSGYYLFRTLRSDTAGCAIVYGNQRAYTIWVTPKGTETVSTPIGPKPADRYDLLYASEKSKQPVNATVWVSRDELRLPYRAKVHGSHELEADIYLFESGR